MLENKKDHEIVENINGQSLLGSLQKIKLIIYLGDCHDHCWPLLVGFMKTVSQYVGINSSNPDEKISQVIPDLFFDGCLNLENELYIAYLQYNIGYLPSNNV